VFIERTDSRVRRQLVLLEAFERRFRMPRGVVFRADGTLRVDDAVSGVIETEMPR